MPNFDSEYEKQRRAVAASFETPQNALVRQLGIERGMQRELMKHGAYKKMRRIIYDPSIEQALWKIAQKRIVQLAAFSKTTLTPILHRRDVDTKFLTQGSEYQIDVYTTSDKRHLNMNYVRKAIIERVEEGFSVGIRLSNDERAIAYVTIKCNIGDLPLIGRTEITAYVDVCGKFQDVKNLSNASQIVQIQAALAVRAFQD